MQVIKDYQLLIIVCVLVLLDIVVLTVWEVVDPLTVIFEEKDRDGVVSL